VFTASAFAAEGDLSTTVITELSGAKSEILAVGGAVLAIVATIALIRYIRSSVR